MKYVIHIIAVFFISLILLSKVIGLHSLSHNTDDGDTQHCDICYVIATQGSTPFLETESPVLLKTEYDFFEKKFINSDSCLIFKNRHLLSYLLTRPPPELS